MDMPALLFQKHMWNHCLRMLSTEVTPDCTVRISNTEGSLSVLSRVLLKLCVGLWDLKLVLVKHELPVPVLLMARFTQKQNRDMNEVLRWHPACYPRPGLE